jgi:hypothetical protein
MGIETGMPNFQDITPNVTPTVEKEGEYKFQHNFKDGTVGRYKTQEEMVEAITEERESADKGF